MSKRVKQKKNKNGLVIEQDLSVNKEAGFKAVKRDKSVNRRAGLHDKKKNLEGDSKVLKRRPLALKRKRIARKVAAVLSVVFVGAVSYVGVGFLKKDNTPIDDPGYASVRYAAPTNGTKPTDHTVVENVAYLNYVLYNQKSWSSQMTSTVYNSFMNQTVETYKHFYDGKLISEDVEKGFSSKITQFCMPEDVSLWRDENGVNHGVDSDWAKKVVLWRGGKGEYKGLGTNWLTSPASGSVITDYRKERGLPPSEFSVYILNELTIKNASETSVIDNGDGTYSMTVELNVNPEGETSAVHYYKQQMKVKGGLSELPKFSYTNVTYVFDENWRMLESEIRDGYRVKMGLSVDCTSVTHSYYEYGDVQTDKEVVNEYYNNYFVKYKNKFSSEVIGDSAPDAGTLLAQAFASVLTDGATFKVDLGLDGKTTQGYAYVGMDSGNLSDLRVTLGKNISAYIAEDSGEKAVYLKLGANAKVKLGLDALTSAFAPAQPTDDSEEAAFSVDDLLKQVLGGELTFNDTKTKATLKSKITLFGVTANINFYFDLNGEEVSLDNVSASLLVGGSMVNAKLRFANDQKPAALTADEKSSYQDVFKNGLSLRGKLDIRAGGNPVSLIIENCALSLNDGISLALKAKIVADGTYNDIYARYAQGKLTFVYGNAYAIKTIEELVDGDGNSDSVSGIAGAVLDLNGDDLQTLEKALVALYNRLIGVANTILENGDLKTAETLDEIIATLSKGVSLSNTADGIFGLLKLPANADGKYTIESVISGLNLYATGSDVGLKLGAFGLEFGFDETGAIRLNLALNISDSEVSLKLSDFVVSTYELPEEPAPESELLTAYDFAEMLDYVGAAAELLVQENLTAELDGSVDLDEGAGYSFNAKLQYSQGANGFPVHINTGKVNENGVREGVNFWIDSTMFAHLNLKLISKNSSASDVFVDFYILDANPVSSTDGITDGAYVADGKLDLYLRISKYAETDANYNPLMLYMPVEDLLTIASMGVSMLNIGGLDFSGNESLSDEQKEDLNNAVKEIANALNQLLISKYLAEDSDRYVSLGDSIINQILSSLGAKQQNLQELLNSVIDSLFATGNEDAQDNEEPEIREGNYIKHISMNGGLNLVLNSASVYGEDKEDLSILVTKQGSGEGSRITGVVLDNIYFGENNANRINLTLGLDYKKVEKPASLDGFRNFGNIDTLVKALVNSATHKTTQAEYESGVKTDYKLNNNFLIAGGITLDVPVIGKVPVAIEGFSVNIDSENKVNFHIRIGLQPSWGVIDGETYIDLSIIDDMIYIKRNIRSKYSGLSLKSCNEVEYRIMPLTEFSANIMENITFMLNMGSTFANIINGIDTSNTNREQLVFNDFGDYISNFISLYQFNSNTNEWTININGDSISKLSGITLKNLSVKLGADVVDGQMLIKKLSLGASLFGAIGVSGDLTYCNPQYDGSDDYDWKPVVITVEDKQFTVKGNKTVDIANDASQGVDGYSWSQLLGGTKFEDICNHVNWSEIVADMRKNYISYNPAGGNFGVADLKFKFENVCGGYTEFGESVKVLYNTSNGKIYTYYVMPEITEMPELNGVKGNWESLYTVEGNSLVYRAVYNVSYVQNEYAVDESYVWNEAAQTYIKTFEKGAVGEKIYLPKDITVEKDGYVYGLNRYIDAMNGGASLNLATYTDSNGKEWFVINADEKFAVTAVWERLYSVTFSSEAGQTVKYFYEGEVLTAADMPAIPEKEGFYGVWANEQIANANGFKVVADDAGYMFTIKYGAMVKVNIISNIALNGINGYGFDGTQYYNNYLENTAATLPDINGYASDKTYYFEGFYQNADFTGIRYQSGYSFNLAQDVTYYAKWVSKTISLVYSSDAEMTLSGETQTTFIYNAAGGELAGCTPDMEGLVYLGWFVKGDDGKYAYVTNVDGIRNVCRARVESAETNASIEVWAMWVTEVNVTTTFANRTTKKIMVVVTTYLWEVHGYVTGGESYGATSIEIASQNNLVSAELTMRYEQCNYKNGVPDSVDDKKYDVNNLSEKFDILNNKTYTFNNLNVSDSDKQYSNNRSYGGARVEVTYKINNKVVKSYEDYSHFESGYNAE